MTGFDDFTMSLLTNEEILKMHRNARHSHQVWRRVINGNEYILWTAASCEGGQYIAVFNAGENDGSVTISLDELEIGGSVTMRELWSGEAKEASTELKADIPSHGAKAFYAVKA